MKRFDLFEDGEWSNFVWAENIEEAWHKAVKTFGRFFFDIREFHG